MYQLLKKIVCLLLLLFVYISNANAQEGNTYTVRDLELWTGAQLKYKMSDLWSMSLEHQYRFKNNASTVDQNFTEFDLKRKLGKGFSTTLGLRYIRNNDTQGKIQGLEHLFRWNLDLGYDIKLDRFTVFSRVRYQSKKEFGTEDDPSKTFRIKLGTEYNIKNWKLDPVLAAEIFNDFKDLEGFNKLRLTLGTEYKLKKLGSISAFYRLEKELVGAYPFTTNIIGIQLKYTFKNKKNEN